jgi:Ribbon-helix-helix protein, copG family
MATRTQIYLTHEQRSRLDALRRAEKRTLADLVREAVDQFLVRRQPGLEGAFDTTFGVSPHLEVPSRDEWDRGG